MPNWSGFLTHSPFIYNRSMVYPIDNLVKIIELGRGFLMSKNIATKIEELIQDAVLEKGFEIVDIEYIKESKDWYLRIFIDTAGGVSIDDCENISKAISQLLDEDNLIKNPYILEVSSPGIERPLKKQQDYERFIGSKVTVKTFAPINGKKVFTGLLVGYENDIVTLSIDDKKQKLTLDKIASANLTVDF